MGFFNTLQSIAAGKTEAEIDAMVDGMHARIGGRLGAYHAAFKALGVTLSASRIRRRRSFRFNTIFRKDRVDGGTSPLVPSDRRH